MNRYRLRLTVRMEHILDYLTDLRSYQRVMKWHGRTGSPVRLFPLRKSVKSCLFLQQLWESDVRTTDTAKGRTVAGPALQ